MGSGSVEARLVRLVDERTSLEGERLARCFPPSQGTNRFQLLIVSAEKGRYACIIRTIPSTWFRVLRGAWIEI